MRVLAAGLILLALILGASAAHAAEDEQPESMWDLIRGKYDANKDGVVSKTEYTRSDAAFGKSDRNKDGVLTSADYRPPRPPPRRARGPAPRGPRPGAGHTIAGGRHGASPMPGPVLDHGPKCPHCGKALPRPRMHFGPRRGARGEAGGPRRGSRPRRPRPPDPRPDGPPPPPEGDDIPPPPVAPPAPKEPKKDDDA